MEKRIRKTNRLPGALMLVSLLLAFSSCVREDLADCPPLKTALRVSFSYDGEDDDPALPPDKAVLFVFDEGYLFSGMTSFDAVEMEKEYPLDIALRPGRYSFVVWTNPGTPYYTTPLLTTFSTVTPAKEDATLNLSVPENGNFASSLPRLRHAAKDNEEITPATGVIHFDLTQNTNRIHFSVTGLERTGDTYLFNIADNNGAYGFDNNFAPCGAFNYTATAAFPTGQDQLAATIDVLRLAVGRNPVLTFSDQTTGQTLYPSFTGQETNLVELIKRAYAGQTVDFDRKHIFHIAIRFDAAMTASVWVDGWGVTESDNELFPD